jgi:HTH-type transcriptional regulator / antitoxin HipB
MKDIALRNAEQLGLALRTKRREKELSQAALAQMLGAERKWIIKLEAGNPKAELGMILKTLDTLGIGITLNDHSRKAIEQRRAPSPTIDDVFSRLAKRPRK